MKTGFLRNVKLLHLYYVSVAIMIVIGVIVMVGAYRSEHSIEEMQKLTEEYTSGQNAINELMDASDYLTEKSRAFVVSGDTEHAHLYQEEVEMNRRRDRAVTAIRDFNVNSSAYGKLEKALDESNELMKTEYYAMLLSAVGHGIDEDIYESFTGGARLSVKDKALSDSEKISKATHLLFDDNYENKKNSIRNNVGSALDELLGELKDRQIASYTAAARLSRRDHVMFLLVMLATFALAAATAFMVIFPMKRSTEYIMRNEPLDLTGSAEYIYLAEAYNRMLAQTMKNHEKLSYEATHDQLTGLLNRKIFEDKRDELQDQDIAMIILDIDHFKEVNDTYGHETGDEVLKKVGAILAASFRLEDYVCRIGGDEFAVIMRRMTPELQNVVRDKINRVQEKLLTRDGLPKTTLSIGVAFSSDEGPEDNIFKKADKALYSIKAAGRDGYAFYNEM